MSSNLKVNSLVPATGTEIGIGTTGGSIDFRCPATFGGNVTIGGTLTYDEVINIDSIGIITARTGLNVSSGTATFAGAIDANGDLDVDGHTNLDNVSIAGITTTGNLYADNLYANSSLTLNNNASVSVNLTSTSTSGSSRIFFGDPDSALVGRINYAHNGDFMQFYTAYSERLRIASNGTIGINSTSPGALLDLSSSQPGILFSETGVSANNGKWLNQANASELYWQAQTDAHSGGGNLFKMTRSNEQIQTFEAQQGGVSWFTIRNSDKTVGIGTNNPGALLTAYGSPAELRLQHTGNSSYSRIISDSSNELKIYTGGGPHLGMIIDGSQNVGIGTDNPAKKLEVFDATQGVIRIRGGGGGSNSSRKADLSLFASGAREYVVRADASDAAFKIVDVSGSNAERLQIASTGQSLFRISGSQTTPINDANVPVQIAETAQSMCYFGANKGSSYGTIFGHHTAFGGTVIRNIQSDDIAFYTSNTSRKMTIRNNGNVDIVNGDLKVASGHGIDFSATGDASSSESTTSMSNELFDDYEEGSWQPTWSPASGSIGYIARHGDYIKIGRTVHCMFAISANGSTNPTGELKITGLPFSATIPNANGPRGGGGVVFPGAGMEGTISKVVASGTTLRIQLTDGSFLQTNNSNISYGYNAAQISGMFSYITAS